MGNIINNFSVDDIHSVREEYARKFEKMSSEEISNFVNNKMEEINKKYNLKYSKKEDGVLI